MCLRILLKLNVNSSGGPDEIKPILLKNIAHVIHKPLAFLFECLFLNGCVPVDWRRAPITPIFKKATLRYSFKLQTYFINFGVLQSHRDYCEKSYHELFIGNLYPANNMVFFRNVLLTPNFWKVLTGQSKIKKTLILFMLTFLDRLTRSFILNYYVNLHHMKYAY